MAGHVVPLDAVVILVVEDGKTGLIVPLLQTLDGQADWIADTLQLPGLQSLIVVRLRFAAPVRTQNFPAENSQTP